MEPNQSQNPPMPPQKETISLPEAKARCAMWQQRFLSMVPHASIKEIPTAIFFHLTDIQEIVDDFAAYNITGVRIYFTVSNTNASNFEIKGIMVPTVASKLDPSRNNDLIIPVPIAGGDGFEEEEGVSIYDFSRPCPTYCDTGEGLLP